MGTKHEAENNNNSWDRLTVPTEKCVEIVNSFRPKADCARLKNKYIIDSRTMGAFAKDCKSCELI